MIYNSTKSYVIKAAVDKSGGIMVALQVPREVASKLAIEGGQPAGSLHVTLVYLGKAEEFGPKKMNTLHDIVADIARTFAPLTIKLKGYGVFPETEDGPCLHAVVIPTAALINLRDTIEEAVSSYGMPPKSDKPYAPHITLAYGESAAPPDALPVKAFEAEWLWVTLGNTEALMRMGEVKKDGFGGGQGQGAGIVGAFTTSDLNSGGRLATEQGMFRKPKRTEKFDESEHPRAEDGKFSESGGGGAPKAEPKWRKVNPDQGTFSIEHGDKHYHVYWDQQSATWNAQELLNVSGPGGTPVDFIGHNKADVIERIKSGRYDKTLAAHGLAAARLTDTGSELEIHAPAGHEFMATETEKYPYEYGTADARYKTRAAALKQARLDMASGFRKRTEKSVYSTMLAQVVKDFVESQHPRDEDGKFSGSGGGKIYMTPDDVIEESTWGGNKQYVIRDPETGRGSGRLINRPLSDEEIPETLYHTTTNLSAVKGSSHLVGQSDGGGMGGGNGMSGVSLTTSRADAELMQKELRRMAALTKAAPSETGEMRSLLAEIAREDENIGGLKPGTLDTAIGSAMQGWEGNIKQASREWNGEDWDTSPPKTGDKLKSSLRSIAKEAFDSYLRSREHAAQDAMGVDYKVFQHDDKYATLKNPLFFGDADHFASLDPANIGIVEMGKSNLPKGALVREGSDHFLHEVRVHGDVPLKGATFKFEGAVGAVFEPKDEDGNPVKKDEGIVTTAVSGDGSNPGMIDTDILNKNPRKKPIDGQAYTATTGNELPNAMVTPGIFKVHDAGVQPTPPTIAEEEEAEQNHRNSLLPAVAITMAEKAPEAPEWAKELLDATKENTKALNRKKKMKKTVVRDAAGNIDHVIEEEID